MTFPKTTFLLYFFLPRHPGTVCRDVTASRRLVAVRPKVAFFHSESVTATSRPNAVTDSEWKNAIFGLTASRRLGAVEGKSINSAANLFKSISWHLPLKGSTPKFPIWKNSQVPIWASVPTWTFIPTRTCLPTWSCFPTRTCLPTWSCFPTRTCLPTWSYLIAWLTLSHKPVSPYGYITLSKAST